MNIVAARGLMQMNWRQKMLVGAAALCAIAAPVLLGQLQTPPSFEVASIKRHPPEGGKGAMLTSMEGPPSDPSRWVASNATTKALIATAYGVKEFQISGGPEWMNSERWDINAKVEDSVAAQLQKLPRAQQQAQQALMLRSLLADRFALEVKRGTKEGTVLALVVAKGGPKLKEVAAPDPQAGVVFSPVAVAPGEHSAPPQGRALVMMNNSRATIASNAAPITDLVDQLSQMLGRQVVDRTGLKGTYQYTLQFSPRGSLAGMPPDAEPSADAAADNDMASIFSALQEQLGLKLESTKGPVDTIAIEHVEEPKPN